MFKIKLECERRPTVKLEFELDKPDVAVLRSLHHILPPLADAATVSECEYTFTNGIGVQRSIYEDTDLFVFDYSDSSLVWITHAQVLRATAHVVIEEAPVKPLPAVDLPTGDWDVL